MYRFGNATLSMVEAELYNPNSLKTDSAELTPVSEPVKEPLLNPTALKFVCEELAIPAISAALQMLKEI